MPELFTWEVLISAGGTMAAATLVATLVNAFWPQVTAAVTRGIMLILCVALQVGAALYVLPITVAAVIVAIFNGLVFAFAAMNAYEKLKHGFDAEVVDAPPVSGDQ
jgi:hypothetical protein